MSLPYNPRGVLCLMFVQFLVGNSKAFATAGTTGGQNTATVSG